MKSYPLVYSFRDIIVGEGFVAAVAINGRAVLTEEDDGDIWVFGVQPGGVAGGDVQQGAAFRQFKENYLSILFDLAEEAPSFSAFKQAVEAFFAETNEPNERDWTHLRALVKSGTIALSGLEKVDADELKSRVEVVLLNRKQSKPTVNQLDDIAQAA